MRIINKPLTHSATMNGPDQCIDAQTQAGSLGYLRKQNEHIATSNAAAFLRAMFDGHRQYGSGHDAGE